MTWNHLFIDAALVDSTSLFAEWPGKIAGQVRLIGASAFGDLFFEKCSGHVEKLGKLDGCVHFVADSLQDFSELMSSSEWQEETF